MIVCSFRDIRFSKGRDAPLAICVAKLIVEEAIQRTSASGNRRSELTERQGSSPAKAVPGTTMMVTLPGASNRADIIPYLNTVDAQ
jgi:hypothetical protein